MTKFGRYAMGAALASAGAIGVWFLFETASPSTVLADAPSRTATPDQPASANTQHSPDTEPTQNSGVIDPIRWASAVAFEPTTETDAGVYLRPAAYENDKTHTRDELLGIDAAAEWYPGELPTGNGIVVAQVEGTLGNYLAKLAQPKQFRNVMILPRSGPSESSGHAVSVLTTFVGNIGVAPGVSRVHAFAVSSFLGDMVLGGGTPNNPEKPEARVFNHSWISDRPEGASDLLRRLDYQIDEYDTIHVAGVNNGKKSSVPVMLGSAHNVIAVGTAKNGGASSGGYTQFEVPGRVKPDLVGPRNLTSYASPMVAGVVARLLEAAERLPMDGGAESTGAAQAEGNDPESDEVEAADSNSNKALAQRSETIKAMLMAGATKIAGWQPEPGRSLDEHLGAGVVNFDQSLRILVNGPLRNEDLQPTRDGQSPAITSTHGWSFNAIPSPSFVGYPFRIDETMIEASFVLTFNRRIDPKLLTDLRTNESQWLGVPRMANFDLELLRILPTGADDSHSFERVAYSASPIDNVEHLYLPTLPAGEYLLRVVRHAVSGDQERLVPWDYAVAWRMEPWE